MLALMLEVGCQRGQLVIGIQYGLLVDVPPGAGGSGGLSSSPSSLLLLGLLMLLWLSHMHVPKAGYHVKFTDCGARRFQSSIACSLALEQLSMALFECLLLFNALSVQDGQAKVQIAELLVESLLLLLELGVFLAELG